MHASRMPLNATAILLLATGVVGAQTGGRCGEQRWPVKVLLDQDTGRVDFEARPTTIGALVAIPRPQGVRPDASRLEHEFRTYRVRARLTEVRDQADGDLHLVLVDIADSTQHLVAEVPDSACAPGSRRASDFAEAQRWARRAGLPIEVEIEGVAFWDDQHGQVGMARNGTTARGEYMPESAAMRTGARPAGGRRCG